MPRRRARRARKQGGFLPFLPLIAAAVPALMGTVAGALDIADKAKRLKEGSGVRRRRRGKGVYGDMGGRVRRGKGVYGDMGGRVRRHRARRGKGVVGDFVSRIPLLGNILGPLARGIGLGLGNLPYENVHMKYGGALMPVGIRNSLVMMRPRKGGLLNAAGGAVHRRRGHYRHVRKGGAIRRVHVRSHQVHKM